MEEIILALQDRKKLQFHIANMYASLVIRGESVDWKTLNDAIAKRWSRSGLLSVKRRAWKIVDLHDKATLKNKKPD